MKVKRIAALVVGCFLYFAISAWTLPWGGVDLNKVTVRFHIERPELKSGSLTALINPKVYLIATVTNHSDQYIEAIQAKCSGFESDGNRIFHEETFTLHHGYGGDLAPGNTERFSNNIPFNERTYCTVTKVYGSR